MNEKSRIGGESPTNDSKTSISFEQPIIVEFSLEGTAALLFHRWSNENVAEKANARKGSKTKKFDDIETFVHRNEAGELCILGEQVRQALIATAKFKQDPRSPRKSAQDLYKAGFLILDEYIPLGKIQWDYVDKRRVLVQRNAITRSRPAVNAGWKISSSIQILLPEYISPHEINELLVLAGRINGLGDFRPTFGRFIVTSFKIKE